MLRDDEEADRQHDVVQRADDRAHGELALEPEPQIKQDREHREDDADGAGLHELARDARTDGLDAAELVLALERVARLLHDRALRRLAAGLEREAQR